MRILAIDQGTSGTKAIVDDDGTTLAVVERPVRPSYRDGGVVEIDPFDLLNSVLDAGRAAIEQAGSPVLDGVSLANQGETVLAWDPATGKPLTPAIVWQDRRSESVCDELREHAAMIARRTGLVLSSYFSAPKMTWLCRNLTTEGVVTTTDTWLIWQLTGEFVTDVTTASKSLLLDLDTRAWDEDLLALFGLTGEPLPRIVRNDEVIGATRSFGGRQTPVGGLIVDQPAALAAQGCLEAGQAKCTYGTGAFLQANVGATALRSENGLITSVAWSTTDRTAHCLSGQLYTLGSAVRWMVSAGLLSSPHALDLESAPDAGGATFVPALAGMAAPWWSAAPSGGLLGMSLATERAHLVRAVIEGFASHITSLAKQINRDTGVSIDRLRVDGGLTRSAVLMQAQADLLQMPVECCPSPHATAYGAVSMARLSLEPTLRLEDAVPKWGDLVTYEPQWSPDRAAEQLARWERSVDTVLSMEEQS